MKKHDVYVHAQCHGLQEWLLKKFNIIIISF